MLRSPLPVSIFWLANPALADHGPFRDQPTQAALKPQVTAILDGSAAPLATVRRPKGEKEPVIDACDTKRLK